MWPVVKCRFIFLRLNLDLRSVCWTNTWYWNWMNIYLECKYILLKLNVKHKCWTWEQIDFKARYVELLNMKTQGWSWKSNAFSNFVTHSQPYLNGYFLPCATEIKKIYTLTKIKLVTIYVVYLLIKVKEKDQLFTLPTKMIKVFTLSCLN